MILYAQEAGERLDAFVAREVPGMTRSAAQRLLEEGCVTVNGKPAKKNYKLSAGDAVEVTVPDPEPVDIKPKDIPLDIVYEDDDMLLINKPAGLVVHPGHGHFHGTLVNALAYHLGLRQGPDAEDDRMGILVQYQCAWQDADGNGKLWNGGAIYPGKSVPHA